MIGLPKKIMTFCHSECLVWEFFLGANHVNEKNQKIHFNFVFLYKNTLEKIVLPEPEQMTYLPLPLFLIMELYCFLKIYQNIFYYDIQPPNSLFTE